MNNQEHTCKMDDSLPVANVSQNQHRQSCLIDAELLHLVSLVAISIGNRQHLQDLAQMAEPVPARCLGQIRLHKEGEHISEFAPNAECAVIDPARCWR